nr:radical SAM protein [Actinomycetota bacterium]
MRVALISTYELGHQPLHLAAPAAALRAAGHDVVVLDTAVEDWDPSIVDAIDSLAFSVPMHTATRLAIAAAAGVRSRRPDLPICFYGLYASMGDGIADRTIAGEYLDALVEWVGPSAPASGPASAPASVASVPWRDALPDLARYARLVIDGEERVAGYVEASRGCVHRCRHCPVPVVYDGRIRIEQVDAVVADVAQQVAAGARHITFGDPDFLNGPQHARRVVAAVAGAFPQLTFDCTVKVEHILRHPDLWHAFAAAGFVFVVSAFESVNDAILERLDKGHTAAEAAEAVRIVRRADIDLRPSWLPFTPWTTRPDVVDILDFVADHDLVASVDPVQYTIRLLLPRGSLLLDDPDFEVGPFDPDRLAYT